MKKLNILLLAVVLPVLSRGQVSVNTSSGTYSQNFNNIQAATYTNNLTNPGWSMQWPPSESDGMDAGSGNYIYRQTSSTECAMGAQLDNGSFVSTKLGFWMKNNSSATLKALTISYTGEQWRSGQNVQTLGFSYDIQPTSGTTYSGLPASGTAYSALDFTGPVTAGVSGPLNGNAPANQVAITATIPVNIPPNTEFYLLWTKMPTGALGKAGLAVDDITVSWSDVSPLPVHLVSFAGHAKGGENILEWTTVQERQNRGFEIWHSQDAVHYSQMDFIASQAEEGNSSQPLSYTYTHAGTAGKNYYKLVQVDADGAKQQSGIVMIHNENEESVRIYPNPVSGSLLYLTLKEASVGILNISDCTGRRVMDKTVAHQKEHCLDVSQLPAGTYIISMNGVYKGRFVK